MKGPLEAYRTEPPILMRIEQLLVEMLPILRDIQTDLIAFRTKSREDSETTTKGDKSER